MKSYNCVALLLIAGMSGALRPANGFAQPMEAGARLGALAGAGVALAGAAWPQENPATLAELSTFTLSFYASQGFSLEALSYGALSLTLPFKAFSAGFDASAFGFELFRELRASATLARTFGTGPGSPTIGLRMQHRRTYIPGYTEARQSWVALGWLVPVAYNVYFGGRIDGIGSRRGERLAPSLALGLAVRPYAAVTLLLASTKSPSHAFSGHGAIEWEMHAHLTLRAGAASNPERISGGLGVRLRRMQVDIAGERHLVLGWTPAVAVTLNL